MGCFSLTIPRTWPGTTLQSYSWSRYVVPFQDYSRHWFDSHVVVIPTLLIQFHQMIVYSLLLDLSLALEVEKRAPELFSCCLRSSISLVSHPLLMSSLLKRSQRVPQKRFPLTVPTSLLHREFETFPIMWAFLSIFD